MTVQRSPVTTGDLREKVTVERFTSTNDGAGGQVRAWTPLTTRWALVQPTGGREALTTPGLQAVQGYRVTMRYGVDAHPEDRLVWKGKKMNIRSAADPDAMKTWWVIFADAGVIAE